MPIKCRYRPNRKKPRTWTEKAAVRVGCSAIQDGESYDRIVAGLKQCAKKSEKEDDCERLRVAVRNLLPIAAVIAVAVVNLVPVLRIIQRIAITANRLYRLLPKSARDSVQAQLGKIDEYVTIEGEFTRIIDDVKVVLREFPAENLPRA